MICVSLANLSYDECLIAIQDKELIELRLDKLNLSDRELKNILTLPHKFIVAYSKDSRTDANRVEKLLFAIQSGAAYIDIEMNLDEFDKNKLIESAKLNNTKVILSYHDYEQTPDIQSLKDIINNALKFNPDIIKIACLAKGSDDIANIISLYDYHYPIIAFSLGEFGKETRLIALKKAPFVYASLKNGLETGDGQYSYAEMRRFEEGVN